MIEKDRIAEVTRYIDAESEEFLDMPDFWRKRDVSVEDLVYVAEQRGLRVVMVQKGINPNQSRPVGVALTPEEKVTMTTHAATFMNGVAVGMELAKQS